MSRYLFRLSLVIWTLASVPAAAVPKAQVHVAEKSTVRMGDPIRLGYLITGPIPDSELLDRVYDLVVFESINSEGEKVLTSSQIATTLRQKLSFQDLQHLALKIPEVVTLHVKRNFLYPTDIAREIRKQALNLCSGCEVEFDDLNLPEARMSEEILRTRLDLQSLRMGGTFLLPLFIETSKGKAQVWVTGKLAFYKEAPVAKRLIRFGESVGAGDFDMKRVNVSLSKDGVPTIADVSGNIAAKTINMGQTVYLSDLKKAPAALRGQIVRILLGDEGFEVSSQGIAQEGGAIGEMIKVKSSDTQKILAGTLVEKGTVRIQ